MNTPQKKIEALLQRLVEEGRERGVQVAAYLEGELVVDASAGIADPATGRPVDGDTLFPIFSTSKGIAATLIHRLVERGSIGYDTRIAEVWPEFGVNGKEQITLDDALWHTSAIPYMPEGLTLEQIHDWPTICAAVAQLTPAWAPRTRAEYHAVTYGWIVGEIACRVDGRPFAQQLKEEISDPLGLNGLFIGIPDEAEPRVAVLDEIFETPGAASMDTKMVSPTMQPLHAWMNRPDARRACLPASNGIMNARSIARHYAALVPGGVDGIELLPPERIREATRWQKPGQPWTPDAYPMRVGGYILYGELRPADPAFGHGGYGGSNGFADPKTRFAVGLTKNLFSPNGAHELILDELKKTLGLA